VYLSIFLYLCPATRSTAKQCPPTYQDLFRVAPVPPPPPGHHPHNRRLDCNILQRGSPPHQGCCSASAAERRRLGSSASSRLSRSKPASDSTGRPGVSMAVCGDGNFSRSRLYWFCLKLTCGGAGDGRTPSAPEQPRRWETQPRPTGHLNLRLRLSLVWGGGRMNRQTDGKGRTDSHSQSLQAPPPPGRTRAMDRLADIQRHLGCVLQTGRPTDRLADAQTDAPWTRLAAC
jgi:hypothetical protein